MFTEALRSSGGSARKPDSVLSWIRVLQTAGVQTEEKEEKEEKAVGVCVVWLATHIRWVGLDDELILEWVERSRVARGVASKSVPIFGEYVRTGESRRLIRVKNLLL
jgi:hypothetical protein